MQEKKEPFNFLINQKETLNVTPFKKEDLNNNQDTIITEKNFYSYYKQELDYSYPKSFVFAAAGIYCKNLFEYLHSIAHVSKNIRCIFIHNPTLCDNITIVKRYKKKLFSKMPWIKKYIKKLPNIDYSIPFFCELVSKFKGQSYNPFEKQIIDYANEMADSSAFCSTPIIISYDAHCKNDAHLLYEILVNDRYKNIKLPVLLIDASIQDFKTVVNTIISRHYQHNLFHALMSEHNKEVINSGVSKKTEKKLEFARWFTSKTPLQQSLIRIQYMIQLLGIIVLCYKTSTLFYCWCKNFYR